MARQPILVMGISGVGKSTVAMALAQQLDAHFVEADAYHPAENVAAMSAGQPLTDEMRWGWLDAVARAVAEVPDGAVFACSALSRAHRDRLRAGAGPLTIIFLHGDRDLIAARMAARKDHFMPTTLIDSQLAALQPPDPVGEGAIWIDVTSDRTQIIQTALAALR